MSCRNDPSPPSSHPGDASACGSATTPCPSCPALQIIDRKTGAVVSGTTITRIVGQKIELAVQAQPAATLSNIQWTVGGTTVKTYTQSVASATKTVLAASDLQTANLDFYWIAGGNTTVSVTATSPGCSLSANVSVHVLAPTGVSFTGEQCPTILGPHFLYALGVNAYNAATAHFGIQWNATCTAPAGGAGAIAITQLITRNFTRTRGGTAEHITSPAQVLDDGLGIQYSGSQPINDGAAATLSGNSYSDSPGSGQLTPDITVVNCSDQFTDFFMYQPTGGDSIWVTLSRLTWSWSGTATKAPPPPPPPPPSGFILGAHSPNSITTQTGAASTTLPEWTANLAPSNNWTP